MFTSLPMTFFVVVLRGLLRRPVRTGLTLVGISIGIGAVVALVGMSRGFETSWTDGMKSRGTDIVVNNMSSGLTPKPFPAAARDRLDCVAPNAQAAETLAERFARGEAAAFDEVVRRYHPAVSRLARRLLGWSADAEDVVQEVFLAALKNARRFRRGASLSTWLSLV